MNLYAADVAHEVKHALLEGYCSSAGAGSEALMKACRKALVSKLKRLPTADSSGLSLETFATDVLAVMKSNIEIDRVILPMLEMISFLFDSQILQKLQETSFRQVFVACSLDIELTCRRWSMLVYLVHKAHYKSNNVSKLLITVQVYRGLSDIELVRSQIIKKLLSMLLHPFPKVSDSYV